jgi:hypothetical protein
VESAGNNSFLLLCHLGSMSGTVCGCACVSQEVQRIMDDIDVNGNSRIDYEVGQVLHHALVGCMCLALVDYWTGPSIADGLAWRSAVTTSISAHLHCLVAV